MEDISILKDLKLKNNYEVTLIKIPESNEKSDNETNLVSYSIKHSIP